ncbi:MAG: hypothetical protein JRI23_30595 [Deltaproteobacteria bacterium]|nr:hypothetical protein [Deltaproteobacteria bacterium]MBW2536535.1 hypothetical protein [Deltaproteobacteria bacterium]
MGSSETVIMMPLRLEAFCAAIAAVTLLLGCRDDRATAPVTAASPTPSASSAPSAAAPRAPIAPLVGPLGGTSQRAPKTEPDPHWADAAEATVELDETFLVELGMGSGLDGLNVTTIRHGGATTHVYRAATSNEAGRRERAWRRVDFRVEPAELSDLVRLLNAQRFLQLEQSYVDPKIQDGAQWIVHVRTRGRDKYVYLSNSFPEPLLKIARFVTELVARRPQLAAQSRPREVDHDTHLWRWRQWYRGCRQDLNPVDNDEGCMPLWVDAQLRSRAPLPPAARFEVTIADRSTPSSVLAREEGRLGEGSVSVRQADVTLTVRYDEVDLRRHYDLVARVDAGERSWLSAPRPVITYGQPHEVILHLEEERR